MKFIGMNWASVICSAALLLGGVNFIQAEDNGQKDDGQKNQKDDGQYNQKDDGQKNQKDDGQQNQNDGNGNNGNGKQVLKNNNQPKK